MSDVNANIGIHFDTADALAQLRQLQAGLSKFNQALTEGNVAAANAQKGLNAQLIQSINATGKFVASQKTIASSTTAFTEALEKNKLSMGQYFRYTAAASTLNSKTLKGAFKEEKDILNRAMKDRVKALQTQYIQLTNANGEFVKTIQVVPKHLKMVNGQYADYATRTQMAAQRQQFMNQLLKQGSTQLLNFGKNTQWAGRQLMVGLTIPLSMLGSVAAKAFREMEEATIKFTRVYGDMLTSVSDTEKAVAEIQLLAKEFTKFGIAAKDTMNMAADAAAMGLTGDALKSQITAATKLAVLGQVEQQQALQTTISLQNAFGISSDQLAQKINFLNAVENQTVLSISDLTEAIPKAAPVIKQLGGSVEDLAYFMTAMKEGGINASEGANALKSGLASMINPSKKASEMLAGFGISIKGIVDANAGNLKGTVLGIARALDTLDPLNRARAIETMFGKFQFARISTLFQNITKDGSQASRALGLASASVEELAILSERELGKVENAVGVKFQKQLENLKIQLMPIGKAFLEAITPVVKFAGTILEKFNNLSDGTKKFIVGFAAILGGIAPVVLMTVGLIANGAANLIKFFAMLRSGMAKLNGQNNVLGGGFDYLTNAETEALAQTHALHASHSDLIATFNIEKTSVDALANAYMNAASQARALASGSPGLFNNVPGAKGAVSGLPKYAGGKKSGVVTVGGTGNQDTELALLTPGETVISAPMSDKYGSLINAMIDDNIPGYAQSKKAAIVKSHTGRVQGGEIFTKLFSGAAIMGPGNQASGPVAGSQTAGLDSNFVGGPEGATDEFKAAFAAAMKTQMMQVDGITKFNDKTYSEYTDSWDGINSDLDDLADIFAGGIVPGVTDISDVGQNQYPLIIEHINNLEKDLKVTAEQANTLRESARKLVNPDLGTTENPGRDAVAKNRQRIETGINANGEEVVTRVGVERVALPGYKGSDYLDDRTKANTAREYAARGVPQPEGKVTFAHIKSGEKGKDFEPPVASEKDGVSEAERNIVSMLESGEKVKEGMVVSKTVQSDLTQAEKIAETQSPSRRTKRLGKNIAQGLKDGLEEGTAEVKTQADKLSEAAIPENPKIDKNNKAFYDDINNPEMSYERQVLKSQDRNRRKRAKSGASDVETSSQEVVASAKVSVRNNSKIDALLSAADKAEENAARSRKYAAELEMKQASQKASGTKSTIANKDIETAKKSAEMAELAAAKMRKRAAGLAAKKAAKAAGDERRAARASTATVEAEEESLIETKNTKKHKKRQTDATKKSADKAVKESEILDTIEKDNKSRSKSIKRSADAEKSTADSAENIAASEDQIEAAAQGRAEVERRIAARNTLIPDGAQTDKVDKRMSYADAFDYAMGTDPDVNNPDDKGTAGFTRDKKGHIMFDPETGEPTKMSRKEITKKKRGMRREKVGKFSGKASGALGMATMVAGAAGAPPAVTGALGAASTVAQFAPMLAGMGPVGWAVAGIAAVGAGAYLLNQHFNKVAAEAAKFAIATSATRESMKKMGELTGKVGASEIMDRRRSKSQYNKYSDSIKMDTTFGNKFMKSDLGKSTKKTFQESIKKTGIEQATQDLSLKLAAQIADGVMSKDQAESIAHALALSIGDQKVEMQVTGKLRTLLGPDGEDLKNKPLQTRMMLVATARQRSEKQLKTIEDKKASGKSVREDIAMLAAYNVNNLELATMQADAVQLEYETQKKKLEVEIASTTNLQKKARLQDQLNTLNTNNLANSQRTNDEILKNIAQTEIDFQKFFSSISIGGQAMREDAYFDASRSTVEAAYKGTSQEEAAKKFLDKTKGLQHGAETGTYNSTTQTYQKNGLGTERAAQTFQAKMEMLVGSKTIGPEEANAWMNLFSGRLNELDLAINTSIKQNGVGKTKELFAMFSGFTKKKVATQMINEILVTKKDPAEFDAIMEALANLQSLDGTAIDMEVLVSQIGLEGVESLKKEFEDIEKMKDEAKKKGTKLELEDVKKKGGTVNPAIEALEKDEKQKAKYDKLNTDQRADYLQKLTAAYAYQTQVDDATLALEAEQYAKTLLWQKGITEEDKDYQSKLKTYIDTYLSKTDAERAKDSVQFQLDPTISSVTPPGGGGAKDDGTRDTTYDEILKRLRNVRLAAINAAGGFEELKRAMAKSGAKAIKDQFNGLEQQLIKTGKAAQFTDYLAGLDQAELNKFGKVATKKGINPITGKKDKNVKVGDFVLNEKGKLMEKAYNKAIIGDYNKAQLQSVTYSKQEIAARQKLLALGYNQEDIATMLADENYRTLIATGKLTDEELKQNAILTEQARIRSKIENMWNKGNDAQKTADQQKRIPEVIAFLKKANVDARGIAEALKDPEMLSGLIDGMDNFDTMAADAKKKFEEVIKQIDGIPDRKIIELAYTQSKEQKAIKGAEAAKTLFDAFKKIDENTITLEGGSDTYAGLQTKIADLNNQSKVVQDQISLTQSKIDDMQKQVDADQRNIEMNISRPIEQKNRLIEKLNRNAELSYSRPIAALQERSNILSHDLDVMNHAAEAINEKYDKQQEALSKVQEINQQIIQQQQQQLGLADALSQGDIAAAAKAAQEMRAASAANYAQNAQDALQQARQNEINDLRGGVSGKSQKAIQEEQYQIGQQVYALEQKKAEVDKQILGIQDEIYTLEQKRQVALDAIQVKTDEIAKIQFGELLNQQNKLKVLNDQVLEYQYQADQLQLVIDANDKNRQVMGHTREEWDNILTAATAAEALASGDLALALGVAADITGDIKSDWQSILDIYNEIIANAGNVKNIVATDYSGAGADTGASDVTDLSTLTEDLTNATFNTLDIQDQLDTIDGAISNAASAGNWWAMGDLYAKAASLTNALDAAKKEEQALSDKYDAYVASGAVTGENYTGGGGGGYRMPASMLTMSSGGLVPKYFATGGFAVGTDTVPAMLTPGEFIMSRYAVNNHGLDRMKAINSGASVGDSVYNYSLTVNAGSNASPDDIARTVMAQIKQIDAQRIRGVRV